MIHPYFEVFCSLLAGENFRTLKIHHWWSLVTNCCPQAICKLMGGNKEINDWAIFWGVLLIVWGWKLQNIEDSSLVILRYQLLPLATCKLMGDNKEFNDSAIFLRCFAHCLGVKTSEHWRFIIGHPWLPIVALPTSKLMDDIKEFNDSAIFWGMLLMVRLWKLQNIEDSSLVDLGYQMLPIATSVNMQSFSHILMCFAL